MFDAAFDEPRGIAFNREGKPISMREWSRLRDGSSSYFRIAEDRVGDFWVSTVWWGLAPPFWLILPDEEKDKRPPEIFKTQVFKQKPGGSGRSTDVECYSDVYGTEAEAVAGHRAAVWYARSGQLEGDAAAASNEG